MSIKFDHTNHKKLWNWLAENPDKNKADWPEWEKNGGGVKRVQSNCFACEYVEERNAYCDECPLDWPFPEGMLHVCSNSLFGRWGLALHGSDLVSNLALQIANLSVKDGVETI